MNTIDRWSVDIYLDETDGETHAEARLATRLSWVAALSFASGLPYFFFNETVPVWLAASGMSLAGIGLATGASLPWALKFLWAPLVDRLGSRRMWIRVCLGLLAVTFGVLAAIGGRRLHPGFPPLADSGRSRASLAYARDQPVVVTGS